MDEHPGEVARILDVLAESRLAASAECLGGVYPFRQGEVSWRGA